MKFLGHDRSVHFIDCDFYAIDAEVTAEQVKTFFKYRFGIPDNPTVREKNYFASGSVFTYSRYKYSYESFPKKAKEFLSRCDLAVTNRPSFKDYYLEGYNVDNITSEWSHILWHYVLTFGIARYSKAILEYYLYRARYPETKEIESTYLSCLKNDKWIAKEDGTFCSPGEISTVDFHSLGYERNDSIERELGFWDYIRNDLEEKERQERAAALESERNELLRRALDKGIDVNEVLKRALDDSHDESGYDSSLITESNRAAIFTIAGSLNDMEINQLAESIREGGYSSFRQNLEIPKIVADNIPALSDIVESVGEDNLPLVAEHADDIMKMFMDESQAPSMVRRVVNYIGRMIYEQYLISEGMQYDPETDDELDFDFTVNDGEKFIHVISTLKSISDNKIPVGLTASQNAFLKNNPQAEIRIIRISLKDISIIPQYERIIGLYGKEEDPHHNERLREACEELARNYWRGVEIEEFDAVSPEYSIRIERKN